MALIVPAPLAEVVAVLIEGDMGDPPLKRGARSYVLTEQCWCSRAVGEGMWHSTPKDVALEQGWDWVPLPPPASGETVYGGERVWAFMPPFMKRGDWTLTAFEGQTRVTCNQCALDDESELQYFREGYVPELFDGSLRVRSSRRDVSDAIEAFLRELLADAEMWSPDVKRKAAERGFAPKTLLNVRKRVVDSRKLTTGHTIWRLRGEQPDDPLSPTPRPYARARTMPGENEGHMGTRGHEDAVEPQSHMTLGGHEGREGHEEYTGKQQIPHDPSEPHDPQGSRGFAALESPHDPLFPYDPSQPGASCAGAREAPVPYVFRSRKAG